MPEFIMPVDERSEAWRDLDSFTQGYIEAMFFTSTGTGDDEGLEDSTFEELAPETLESIKADCAAFQSTNADLLERAYELLEVDPKARYVTDRCEAEQACGRDYWFSRNGHGVGFWDRGLGDVGDKLHMACRYSERYLCRGDDGLLYLE
jgi:hypothetical protein